QPPARSRRAVSVPPCATWDSTLLPPGGRFPRIGSRPMAADPDCRFCQIVAGDETAHVVFEDERTLAFLDNRPLFPGHSLLVPRDHHETLGDLPDDLIDP